MKKIIFIELLLILTLLCGCANQSKESNSLKIGAILPLSGNTSVIGEPKKRALEMAAEQFSNSGREIEIVFEDSKGNAKDGITSLNKMINDSSIEYYYIDLTPIVNACVPIINNKKILTFAGSAEPQVTNLSNYLFRLFAGGDQEIDLILKYLYTNDIRNICILHTNELYGNNAAKFLKERFVKNDGNILGAEKYPMNNMDFKNLLSKIKDLNPEKIVLLGYGNEYAVLLKQAHELGITSDRFLCNLGGSNKVVTELPKELNDEMVFIGPNFTYLLNNGRLNSDMKKFVESYMEKYKEIPDFRAAYVYDTVAILLHAVEQSEKTKTSILEIISNIKDYNGVSGKISFLQNGDSQTDLIIAKYSNGKIILCD